MLSCIWLFMTPWTVAHQAPLSTEFSRQGYWSGLPFPTQGDLPDPGIKPVSPVLAGGFFYHWVTWEAQFASTNPATWNSQFIPLYPPLPWATTRLYYVYAHSISCVKALANSGFLYDLIIWEHLYLASGLPGSWWILDRNQRPFPIQLALNKTIVKKETLMHLLSHSWFN